MSRSDTRRSGLILSAALTLSAVAGLMTPLVAQGAGSGATTLLRVAPGPRPLALGNAYSAVPAPLAVEYNPAAVAGSAGVGAYQSLPVGASAGTLAAAFDGAVTVAFSVRFLDYGEVDVLESDGSLPVGQPTGERVGGGEVSALLGTAVSLGPLRLGLAGRWLRQEIASLSDDAVALDAGALLTLTDAIRLGGAIQHMGPDMEAGRAAPLPRTLRLGAAAEAEMAGLHLLLTAEARRREERTGGGAGLEVGSRWTDGEATLRLGYELRPDDGDAFSPLVVGGGIRLGPLGVDLAWRSLGPLGSTRQVGLRYRF